MTRVLGILLLVTLTAPALAQPQHEEDERIEDNSFLVEEAYNQEPGVIQHIATFQRPWSGGGFVGTYTEEWPFLGQKHQVSVTAQVQRTAGAAATGLGDVAFNYRNEVFRSPDSHVVACVRLSALFPTGDATRGLGAGGMGAQLNVPVSVVLGDRFVTHVNWGGTFVPSGGPSGARGETVQFNMGQSLVWLPFHELNLLVEAVGSVTQTTTAAGTTQATSVLLSPGFRHEVELAREWEIVWGAALPIGLGPSAGERAALLYLSFEHRAW
jgi:hypothetical protein